jgi:hypothetical protein
LTFLKKKKYVSSEKEPKICIGSGWNLQAHSIILEKNYRDTESTNRNENFLNKN